jgi:6-pyruvoyltetrahydropterin/6-carboxytetrahydropterin synthase
MNEALQKPRKVYVTRRIEFNAAHRLYNPLLTDEENRRVYGKCSNEHGHGHNYALDITVCGTVNPATGFLLDLKELKAILEEEIVARFDHKHLNFDVRELEQSVPTTELLAVIIWDILESRLRTMTREEIFLHEVRILETEKNSVRYLGE